MSAAKCRWRAPPPPRNAPRRARAAGAPARRSGRPAGLLALRAAAVVLFVLAALIVSVPRGCRGGTASQRRSGIGEPPWGGAPPTAVLSPTLKGRALAAGVPPQRQRRRQLLRSPLVAAQLLSPGAVAGRAAAVRQRAPAASPRPTPYAKDYAQLELPRRKKGEVYFYTRVVLTEPASGLSGSNFGITALRTAMGKRLGGFPAELVVMVHVFEVDADTPGTTARSVSLFLALAPARLKQQRIDAFNEAVATRTFDVDLRAQIRAGTVNASLFSVQQDRPLVLDRDSMKSHGPSGHPLSSKDDRSAPSPAKKSILPIIVGVVGAVVVVAALAGVGWCVHSRRSASRVASPRDLTRYSEEESGTRQSSFPSSLASLPLPSFRGSIERVRKPHPDDNDRAA